MEEEISTCEDLEMEDEMNNWWFDEMSYYYDDEALGEVFDKDND